MKATELMIGDWVFCNEAPIRVENIHGDCINFQYDIPFVQEEFLIEYSEIEPIPLTVEILEKNGFKRAYRQGDLFFVNGKTAIEAGGKLFHDNRFYLDDIMIPLFYVHELQHALRLHRWNEVADNFKI